MSDASKSEFCQFYLPRDSSQSLDPAKENDLDALKALADCRVIFETFSGFITQIATTRFCAAIWTKKRRRTSTISDERGTFSKASRFRIMAGVVIRRPHRKENNREWSAAARCL